MRIWIVSLVVATACTGTGSPQRSRIREANALGAVAFESARVDEGDGAVFRFRAFDASDAEVAALQLRIGDEGSEISIDARGRQQRVTSREVRLFHLEAWDPQVQELLELPIISSTMQREANIEVIPSHVATEVAYGVSCDPAHLKETPVADQCCEDYAQNTYFINDSRPDTVVQRVANPNGKCKMAGGASCSGMACDSGPEGYYRANFYTMSGTHSRIEDGAYGNCSWNFYTTLQSPIFSPVQGDGPDTASCCIDGSGPCNVSGYPQCSACGGVISRDEWGY